MDATVDPTHSPRRTWVPLRTQVRWEKVVRTELMKRNVECLLPTSTRISLWKGQRKEIEWPFFSGYCFARLAPHEHVLLFNIPGIIERVGCNTLGELIMDKEIENLRRLSACNRSYRPHPYSEDGVFVEVIQGPLKGVRGHCIGSTNNYRLVVGIQTIQQAASVQIDLHDMVLTTERQSILAPTQ